MRNRKFAFIKVRAALALCLALALCALQFTLALGETTPAPDITDYMGGSEYQYGEAEKALMSGILPRAEALLREASGQEDISQYSRSCSFRTGRDGQPRWWLITFTRLYGIGEQVREALVYAVAFVLGDKPHIVAEAREDYLRHLKDIESELALYENEEKNGPFYTWPLEMKAQAYPDWCTLPREGDISRDAALSIARGYLIKRYGFTDEMLDMWHPFFFFTLETLDEDPQHACWRVDFYTDEGMAAPTLNGYTVIIEPVTGEVLSSWDPFGNG